METINIMGKEEAIEYMGICNYEGIGTSFKSETSKARQERKEERIRKARAEWRWRRRKRKQRIK